MDGKPIKPGKITPEKAVEILRQSNIVVSTEQAKEILDLLQILARLEVEQYLRK